MFENFDDIIFLDETPENELAHYGRGHLSGGHSGRYPWGSGEHPYQDSYEFMAQYKKLHDEGYSDTDIARMWNYSTTDFRAKRSLSSSEIKRQNISTALRLKATGMSNTAIAEEMKTTESNIRNWLKPQASENAEKVDATAETLKKELELHDYIQVGSGIEAHLGVSKEKLNYAVALLKEQGYEVINVPVEQFGTSNRTIVKVLAPAGTTYKELITNREKIALPIDYHSTDGGKTQVKLEYPKSLDRSRIQIHYGDEEDENGVTGSQKDGVIEIRRGVQDLSMGNANYAQVRIAVDNKYYLKGMAIYSDDLPEGVDVRVNSNKPLGTPDSKVFKILPGYKTLEEQGLSEEEIKAKINTASNPQDFFGATIKAGGQLWYEDANGEKQLGVINKVNEEGDWDSWSRTLSSQLLSKQSVQLAKQQLDLSYAQKKLEFEEICNLDNEVIKKDLLDSFADDCDASAVHLKAAALPRQRAQVILPVTDLKSNEIYAPNFKNGETVVLVRYPHGGIFEIPELTVNNNQKNAKSIIGNAIDAVGISLTTAAQLSGADFDGDTVLVIPNNDGAIKTSKPLEGLKNFSTDEYKFREGETGKVMLAQNKGMEMGKITNLITDMTIKGASPSELTRAVKHSMVVIDAVKHELNYEQSFKDNNIQELINKYQKKESGKAGGASTLISKASSTETIEKRKAGGYLTDENGEVILNSLGKPKKFYVNPNTGEKMYTPANETYEKYVIKVPSGKYNKDGTEKLKTKEVSPGDYYHNYKDYEVLEVKTKVRTEDSTKMYEAKDAYSLLSTEKTPIEKTYADYANSLKALGNQARKESLSLKTSSPINTEARKIYAAEMKSLDNKLENAKKNEPLERQARIIANTKSKTRIQANPEVDGDSIRKIYNQELAAARAEVGASGRTSKIEITDREWEAIQSGAISYNKQEQIVRYANKDILRNYATPKKTDTLTTSEINLIKALYKSGYVQSDIAERLGVSASTINKYVKEK